MKRYFLLSCILIASVISVRATDYQVQLDSLNALLEHSTAMEKADVLYQLARLTAPYDQVLCKSYIDQQQELLEGVEDEIRLGNLYHNKGFYYYYLGEYIEALDNFNKSTQHFEKTQVRDQIAMNYYLTVMIMFNTGNLEKGMEMVNVALEMARQSGDPWTLVIGLYGVGYFYNNFLRDFEKSKEFNSKAYKMTLDYNLASSLKGGTCMGCAIAYFGSGEADTAIYLSHKAIHYYHPEKNIADQYMMIQGLHGIGYLFQKTNQSDSANYYYSLALNRADAMTAVFAKAYIHSSLGSLNLETGDINQAVQHFNQVIKNALIVDSLGVGYLSNEYAYAPVHAWDVSIKLMAPRMLRNYAKNYLLDAYGQLSVIYENRGQLNRSIYYLKKKHEVEQTLNDISKSKDLVGLQIAYETERKDQQITLLSQENELKEFRVKQSKFFLFGLLGIILVIIVAAILFIRQNKFKAEQNTIILEQRLLRSQMNPHFIFNALSNISNLIDKNDNITASNYLTKFSQMVRHILESTRSDFIEFDREVVNIKNYLALQKLRFTDKFDYKIEVDEKIDSEGIEIPPMLIQPFVENAIEHGIKTKETKGNIDIRFKLNGDQILCKIDDDGVGRTVAGSQIKKGHTSMATEIVHDRLETLGKKLKQKLNLEIIDMKTETNVSLGTRVIIGLPYRES